MQCDWVYTVTHFANSVAVTGVTKLPAATYMLCIVGPRAVYTALLAYAIVAYNATQRRIFVRSVAPSSIQ